MGEAEKERQELITAIERGNEPFQLLRLVTEHACSHPRVLGAALVLQPDRTNSPLELVTRTGDIDEKYLPEIGNAKLPFSPSWNSTFEGMAYFAVNSLGSPIGYLAIRFERFLSQDDKQSLAALAHHASCIYDRHRLSESLQFFLHRLEVINELTQLIVSNASLKEIARSLCREAKLRFSSEQATLFMFNEHRDALTPLSGLGLSASQVPERVAPSACSNHELEVIETLAEEKLSASPALAWVLGTHARCAHIVTMRTQRETVGILVLGYKEPHQLDRTAHAKLTEFSQSAAVALANARNYEQLASYSSRLEDIVAQRTSELAVQIARAEDANKQKSQFISNISHEFRTPLTGILGYTSILLDGLYGDLSEEQKDALQAVTKSAEHLKSLVDEVLSLARVESGKEKPEPTPVPVYDVLRQTHKLVLQTAVGKGIELQPIEYLNGSDKLHLFVDRKHANQIIINLLSNAIKYTPKGGKVWLKAEPIEDKVRIFVQDTGVGMSPQKLERLFERFERGEDQYSKNQEGTGIGLNLTRTLIEINGGVIEVTSEVGVGSVFSVSLPKADEAAVQADAAAGTPLIRMEGLKLLVVDDSADTREVISRILRAAGADVTIASSVEEGLSALGKAVPDVVLTDIAMAQRSGLELIRFLRGKEGARSDVPIVVLSAHAMEKDRQAAMDAGASLFISKPCTPKEILEGIQGVTKAQKH